MGRRGAHDEGLVIIHSRKYCHCFCFVFVLAAAAAAAAAVAVLACL